MEALLRSPILYAVCCQGSPLSLPFKSDFHTWWWAFICIFLHLLVSPEHSHHTVLSGSRITTTPSVSATRASLPLFKLLE